MCPLLPLHIQHSKRQERRAPKCIVTVAFMSNHEQIVTHHSRTLTLVILQPPTAECLLLWLLPSHILPHPPTPTIFSNCSYAAPLLVFFFLIPFLRTYDLVTQG
jgi:hypothetical protein